VGGDCGGGFGLGDDPSDDRVGDRAALVGTCDLASVSGGDCVSWGQREGGMSADKGAIIRPGAEP
jgi:hypothetical protein